MFNEAISALDKQVSSVTYVTYVNYVTHVTYVTWHTKQLGCRSSCSFGQSVFMPRIRAPTPDVRNLRNVCNVCNLRTNPSSHPNRVCTPIAARGCGRSRRAGTRMPSADANQHMARAATARSLTCSCGEARGSWGGHTSTSRSSVTAECTRRGAGGRGASTGRTTCDADAASPALLPRPQTRKSNPRCNVHPDSKQLLTTT